ncbi:MAG: hypothetical protein IJS93_01920 [Clostridia bacterium]|nr:hypothetical protein [Clostridia bacterium]
MKKTVVFFALIFIAVFAASCLPAFADEGDYYVVGESKISFYVEVQYAAPQEKFEIPKGFAIKVVGSSVNNYTPVEYSGLRGLVKSDELANCVKTASPERISPTFLLTARPPKAYTAINNGIEKNLTDKQAVFLGVASSSDGAYYAVKVDDEICYIYESNVENKTDLDNYLNPKTEVDPDPIVTPSGNGEKSEEEGGKNNVVLRIILIAGIVIPAVIVVILLFKPRKANTKKRRQLEDDGMRYEDFE